MKTMFRTLALAGLTAMAAADQTPATPGEDKTARCQKKAEDGSEMCAKKAAEACCCCRGGEGHAAHGRHAK